MICYTLFMIILITASHEDMISKATVILYTL